MESGTLNIVDLPTDVILSIIQYLSPAEHLRFCSTSRILQSDPEVFFSAPFWRNAIKTTFRVPNQPVVAGDGRRWMRLYRRMRTQTKPYGWGQNDGFCFGEQPNVPLQESIQAVPAPGFPGGVRPMYMRESAKRPSRAPVELNKGAAGVVSDIQCGGWSVTMLDSRGVLYTTGCLDQGRSANFRSSHSLTPSKLIYPPGFFPRNQNERYRYDPYTAIKQFSSGRSHILGLSDSGRIWSWHAIGQPAVHIKFLPIDLVESHTDDISHRFGAVRQVVAGWGRSTAYVVGTGIVIWPPSNDAEMQGAADQSGVDGADVLLILAPKVVPDSWYLRSSRSDVVDQTTERDNANIVGEVTNYIVLQDYVVFVTHLGKVFACAISNPGEEEATRTIQILPVSTDPGPASPDTFVIDVQGSFLNFAIFKQNGEVLIGDFAFLHSLWAPQPQQHFRNTSRPSLRKIPCLQNTGVISMAFGDYHYHALHADGSISSYGHEPRCLGAFGVGARGEGTALLRGLQSPPGSPDREFLQECFTTGRRVAFEPEKQLWLQQLWEDSTPGVAARKSMCLARLDVRAEVSEWVEQRLNAWEQVGRLPDSENDFDDDVPAYFALSVAAAGWHSAALVLVDEDKAQIVRERHRVSEQTDTAEPSSSTTGLAEYEGSESMAPALVNRALGALASGVRSFLGLGASQGARSWVWKDERFPRLRLRSGEVMPGVVNVVDWVGPREWKRTEWVTE